MSEQGYTLLSKGKSRAASAANSGSWLGFLVAAAIVTFIAVAITGPIADAYSAAAANDASKILANTSVVTAAITAPCSKYRAFGTQGTPQGFLPSAGAAAETMVNNQLADDNIPGMYVAGGANGELHHYEAGFADFLNNIPFTNKTVMRIASQSKFIGTAAFLKFMSESNVNGDDLLETYIPAFASVQVIHAHNPVTPYLVNNIIVTTAGSNVITFVTTLQGGLSDGDNVTISGVLAAVDGIPAAEINGQHTIRRPSPATPIVFTIRVSTQATAGTVATGGKFIISLPWIKYNNVLSTAAASNVVTVTTPSDHGFETGDSIALFKTDDDSAVDGIPAVEIAGTHSITVTSVTQFTFTTTTNAGAGVALVGGGLQLALVPANVLVARPDFLCNPTGDYYTLAPPSQPPIVRHIMDHSLGYAYSQWTDFFCSDLSAPFRFQRETLIQNRLVIQANLAQELELPGHATSGLGIQTWALQWAQIPLAFDPGSYWIYGPQTSFLGAIIEIADASAAFSLDTPPKARTVEQYMQEAIFEPVGMEDTMFFIQDTDPRRADLLSRMSELYFSHSYVPVTFIFPFLQPAKEWAYATGMPRSTAMISGGLLSTPADLLKFYDMIRRGGKLADGTQLIPASYLAEASRTQNVFFENYYRNYPGATWGLGVPVISHGGLIDSTGVPMGDRVIAWSGAFGTTFYVDFGQDTFGIAGGQFLGFSERYRIAYSYNAHLKCIEPQSVDAVSLPTN
jgi:CubicO group peptidase (beta-lactamase class C family)